MGAAVAVAVIALAVGLLAVGVSGAVTREAARGRRGEPREAVVAMEQAELDGPSGGLAVEARQRARIHRYAMSDPGRGLAAIPIPRAIDMAAAGCRPPGAGEPAFARAPDPSCPPSAEPAPGDDEPGARAVADPPSTRGTR